MTNTDGLQILKALDKVVKVIGIDIDECKESCMYSTFSSQSSVFDLVVAKHSYFNNNLPAKFDETKSALCHII